MAKFLIETFYTCSFKVSHYLDDINENNLKNLEKNSIFSLQMIYSLSKFGRYTDIFKYYSIILSKKTKYI